MALGFTISAGDGNNGTAVDEVGDEILSKFRNFKQFDIVEDASDHYFFSNNSSVKQVIVFYEPPCFSSNLGSMGLQ